MRLLFCWSAAEVSTVDVAHGYRGALEALGCEIVDWRFMNRLKWVAKAFDVTLAPHTLPELSRHACQLMVADALEHQVDWVVIASGMGVHPNGVLLLKRAGFKVAVVFSESPYDEEHEAYFAALCDVVATNERTTAERHGWLHLPPAYEPTRHRLVPEPTTARHDVVFVGTGWDERVKRLAQVNWEGIDLGIYGLWPQLSADQDAIDFTRSVGLKPDRTAREKLGRFYTELATTNETTVELYSAAKVALNDHRVHPTAVTPNPRVYEVLAVGGALLLTDERADLADLLGRRWREYVYADAGELEEKTRYYLSHEFERRQLALRGQTCVQGETFEARARLLLGAMERVSERKVVAMAR